LDQKQKDNAWLGSNRTNIIQPEASSVNRGDLVGSQIPSALFHFGPSKMNDDQSV
jgi:hypothetical protein